MLKNLKFPLIVPPGENLFDLGDLHLQVCCLQILRNYQLDLQNYAQLKFFSKSPGSIIQDVQNPITRQDNSGYYGPFRWG